MSQTTFFGRSLVAGLATAATLCVSPVSALAQEQPAPVPNPNPVVRLAFEPQGFIDEPDLITRATMFADRNLGGGSPTQGVYADLSMVPGAGWISAGPGYRHWYAKDYVFVDASAALSWRAYKTAQARFELPRVAKSRLALGSQVRWQNFTQVKYFGEGPETLESTRGQYRLRSTNLVGYATVRPVRWLGIGAEIGWLKPSISPRTLPDDRPHTPDVSPGAIVFLPDEMTFVHSEGSIGVDARNFPGHATRGGLIHAAAANYSDRDAGVFSFRRYEGEAEGFVPLAGERVVLALHGWMVASATSDGQSVPFYLQPSLGGGNTLRGYADYRFHGRNLLVVNVETRIAMMTHVDAALFVDAGNVGARIRELNLDKRSYGAGLRLHSRRQTFARLDVARGTEGWRVMFNLTDPLHLGRLSRRTAAVPFVP